MLSDKKTYVRALFFYNFIKSCISCNCSNKNVTNTRHPNIDCIL
jgi:hypothetical protein